MRRTELQEQFSKVVWDTHEQGRTVDALQYGQLILQALDKERDQDQAMYFHTAMQMVVMYGKLARTSTNIETAVQSWHRAIDLVVNDYPIATSAQIDTLAWQDVLPGEASLVHAWQPVTVLLREIGQVTASSQVSLFSTMLRTAIIESAQLMGTTDRSLDMFTMREGEYPQAKEAYTRFVRDYGVGSQAGMPSQQAILSALMLRRSIRALDLPIIRRSTGQLIRTGYAHVRTEGRSGIRQVISWVGGQLFPRLKERPLLRLQKQMQSKDIPETQSLVSTIREKLFNKFVALDTTGKQPPVKIAMD